MLQNGQLSLIQAGCAWDKRGVVRSATFVSRVVCSAANVWRREAKFRPVRSGDEPREAAATMAALRQFRSFEDLSATINSGMSALGGKRTFSEASQEPRLTSEHLASSVRECFDVVMTIRRGLAKAVAMRQVAYRRLAYPGSFSTDRDPAETRLLPVRKLIPRGGSRPPASVRGHFCDAHDTFPL
jgi:hypothetical protein